MSRPKLRSLYWRIGFGFIICVAGVIVIQSFTLLWLMDHSEATQGGNLTQDVGSDIGRLLTEQPTADIDQYVAEHYSGPSQSFFAVLRNGKILAAGKKKAPKRAIQAAVEEFERGNILSIPTAWQGDPYRASAIVVDGQIVGAVAVVPETWVERLARIAPILLAMSVGLLIVGTAFASALIFRPAHRRLQELEAAAVKLGAGDMTIRARDDGGDEVASVARAFNQMAGELAASDRTRRLLFADVSHELMTPLTAARGYQEQLANDPAICASQALSHYVSIIGDETQRLQHIVGDLLDLAKLEGAATPLDMQDVSIEGLFGRVAARHASEAADRSLRISTSIEPGAEIVYGDRFRLEQALQNLAANAIRHVRDSGSVVLRARVQDATTVLSVSDDGGGIAKEHLPFVFDRFYKVDPSRSRDSAGSGLGLSIVKAIVERHGGTVSVSSEHEIGTTFQISLPTGLPRSHDGTNKELATVASLTFRNGTHD
jgi:signal transduction histidine kinase